MLRSFSWCRIVSWCPCACVLCSCDWFWILDLLLQTLMGTTTPQANRWALGILGPVALQQPSTSHRAARWLPLLHLSFCHACLATKVHVSLWLDGWMTGMESHRCDDGIQWNQTVRDRALSPQTRWIVKIIYTANILNQLSPRGL